MYGCFLVPPDDDGADLGVLFWHKDGYSTACGHGTIALGAWAVESGRVAAPPAGARGAALAVPCGRVGAPGGRHNARGEPGRRPNAPPFAGAHDAAPRAARAGGGPRRAL